MTVHHLRGSDDHYLIVTDQADDGRPAWRHRSVSLHTPTAEARAEWNILGRHSFGLGATFGRNGSESDVGLDLHAGPLGSLWLRLRAPWTKWAQVTRDASDGTPRYYARHTGIRLHPHPGCIASVQVDNPDGYWSRDAAWWRENTILWSSITGRTKTVKTTLDAGVCSVPMPEGAYDATYSTDRVHQRHVRLPGTILDRLRPKSWITTSIDIPSGIPVEGKGENSWDCGMDGTFGISAPGRVSDAIGSLVASVMRDRSRYGGPHNLTAPTTVADAGAGR